MNDQHIDQPGIDPLEITFEVACSQRHAFHVWTDRIDAWWPRNHTATDGVRSSIRLEQQVGGRLLEVTRDGQVHLWGTVTAWQPPELLAYTWHIRRDPVDATDVQIRFTPVGDRTRIDIVHSGWERLGAEGPSWRDLNRGGWDGVLPHFVRATDPERVDQPLGAP